jgi:Zn-finger nucleic acid-binding protein
MKDRSVPGPDAAAKELAVERCPSCGGVWFDLDELNAFLDSGAGLTPSSPAPASGPSAAELDAESGSCPKCGVALVPAPAPTNPKVRVDRCVKCAGLWVDGAELDRVSGKDLPFNERLKAVFGDLSKGVL